VKKYYIETYGCQMNKAESQAVAELSGHAEWEATDEMDEADAVIVHTCSVRKSAEQRIWGRLGELSAGKRGKPYALAVIGCMVDRLGTAITDRVPGVDLLLGNAEKLSVFSRINGEAAVKPDIPAEYEFPEQFGYSGRVSAFVPIMHGCDNWCSYCVVPSLRGGEISRDPETIIRELTALGESGTKEVTLLGQNVNSYSSAAGGKIVDFPDLLEIILRRTKNIRWIRFLTSHPKDLSEKVVDVMKSSDRLCSHIHLPLQSGSDKILGKMNRKYTFGQYRDIIDKIRKRIRPVSITTDIIVGFPGEGEDDFKMTVDALKSIQFDDAFLYKYNVMEGTRAAEMDGQVPEEEKHKRLTAVIELQRGIAHTLKRRKVGSLTDVLVEQRSKKSVHEYLSRTELGDMVIIPSETDCRGSFQKVRLSGLSGATLKGEILWYPGN
jgi:tRNA-2-methylthio-N6-dimethylallyladenosine synthase